MISLDGLQPGFRPYVEQLLALGREAGLHLVVTSARRTRAEQERQWNRWRTHGGLPAARPGTSKHEKGLAVDIARPGVDPRFDPVLPLLGRVWVAWGGRWGSKDPVHFAAP